MYTLNSHSGIVEECITTIVISLKNVAIYTFQNE